MLKGNLHLCFKKLILFLALLIYFLIAYYFLNYFNITCIFLYAFGIPCPGCGMTRAFMSILNLDFWGALKYNVTIFFMPYIFLYVFLDFKHKVHKSLLTVIAIIAVINWGIKLLF